MPKRPLLFQSREGEEIKLNTCCNNQPRLIEDDRDHAYGCAICCEQTKWIPMTEGIAIIAKEWNDKIFNP